MPTNKQPQQEATHQTGDGLDAVRTAYSKLVNHVKKQQDKIGQLESRLAGQQGTIGKLEERIDELTALLEIVQQHQYEMGQREEARAKPKSSTPAPEQSEQQRGHTTPKQQQTPQSEPEQTHHSTTITEGQKKLLYHLAVEITLPGTKKEQVTAMIMWAEQTCQKKFDLLTQREFFRLKESLEQAKGKGVLPNLQPGREYSQAS